MKKTKLFSIIVAITMIISAFSAMTSLSVSAAADKWDGAAKDTAWYDSESASFELDTAAELAGFAKLINDGNNFAGKTVKLTVDVDLDNKDIFFGPVFKGVFDGGNKTISNVAVSTVYKADPNLFWTYGMFGAIAGDSVSIKNLKVEGLAITAAPEIKYCYVGAIVGFIGTAGTGTVVENCTVSGLTVKVNGTASGGGYTFVSAVSGFTQNAPAGAERTVKNVKVTASEDYLTSNYTNKVAGVDGVGNQSPILGRIHGQNANGGWQVDAIPSTTTVTNCEFKIGNTSSSDSQSDTATAPELPTDKVEDTEVENKPTGDFAVIGAVALCAAAVTTLVVANKKKR